MVAVSAPSPQRQTPCPPAITALTACNRMQPHVTARDRTQPHATVPTPALPPYSRSAAQPVHLTHVHMEYFKDARAINSVLLEPDKVDRAEVLRWLPAPADICTAKDGTGSYDVWIGGFWPVLCRLPPA